MTEETTIRLGPKLAVPSAHRLAYFLVVLEQKLTKMPTLDLSSLAQTTVIVTAADAIPDEGCAAIRLTFSDGTCMSADYWRLIIDGRQALSSFDHYQKYGLPSPINAKERLHCELTNRRCICALLDEETRDLVLEFAPKIKLQIFNFTGYEIWTIRFADGREHYSNHTETFPLNGSGRL